MRPQRSVFLNTLEAGLGLATHTHTHTHMYSYTHTHTQFSSLTVKQHSFPLVAPGVAPGVSQGPDGVAYLKDDGLVVLLEVESEDVCEHERGAALAQHVHGLLQELHLDPGHVVQIGRAHV